MIINYIANININIILKLFNLWQRPTDLNKQLNYVNYNNNNNIISL